MDTRIPICIDCGAVLTVGNLWRCLPCAEQKAEQVAREYEERRAFAWAAARTPCLFCGIPGGACRCGSEN
jgi:hypothetical protein